MTKTNELPKELYDALRDHSLDEGVRQGKLFDKARKHLAVIRDTMEAKYSCTPRPHHVWADLRSEASCLASIFEDMEIGALAAKGRLDASEREVKAAAKRLRDGKGWAEYVEQDDLRFYGNPEPEDEYNPFDEVPVLEFGPITLSPETLETILEGRMQCVKWSPRYLPEFKAYQLLDDLYNNRCIFDRNDILGRARDARDEVSGIPAVSFWGEQELRMFEPKKAILAALDVIIAGIKNDRG